jgi:hypothetical protein
MIERTARESMPDREREKQDRRLISVIKSGMHYSKILATYRVTESRLNNLAKAHGLTIVKLGNNKGVWGKP